MKTRFDILIVGGGLIGKIAAIALSDIQGLSVVLVDKRDILSPKALPQDGRATALSTSSLNLLKNLHVEVSDIIEPMQDMLITEGDLGDEPAWRLHFEHKTSDKGAPHLIENRALNERILSRLTTSGVTILSKTEVTDITHAIEGVSAKIDGKPVEADLLVAADGGRSKLRMRAGIDVDGRDYDQSALVTTIKHELPHDGLALQRFLPGGPLAVLPLQKQRSQIVWSHKPSAIKAAMALSDADFLSELSFCVGDYLGKLSLDAPRQSYPLHLQLAQTYVASRFVLIGDAAHVIHPLAGQGLNLGLRDVAALFDVVSDARKTGRDIGGAVLGEYEAWRKSDVTALAGATDILSYIYASPRGFMSRPLSKAFGHIRRVGLSVVNEAEFLKNLFILEATGNTGKIPVLLK